MNWPASTNVACSAKDVTASDLIENQHAVFYRHLKRCGLARFLRQQS